MLDMSSRARIAVLPDDAYITRGEASAFLNCRPTLLEEWATKGSGPPYLKNGRWVRYQMGALRAWAAAHTRQTVQRRRVLRGVGA